MAINSRQKGARYERELAKAFRNEGYSGARRSVQYSGANGDADVVGLPGIPVEAKHVEHPNIHHAMDQAVRDARAGELPVVFHRKKSAPTRIIRYCCSIFKESYGRDAIMLTGVRAKESVSRKNRDAFEVIGKTKQNVKRWDLKNAKEAYQDAQVLPEVYDCQLITNAKKKQ